MATRVLMTVRDKDQLIVGFKIINSKQGMCIKLFKKFSQNPVNSAEEYYKIVGGFENVSYKGHGQWEGIDCRLNSFPSIDTNGNPLDMNEKGKYFILGKYLDGDFVAGYKIMDLNGQVTKMSVEDTFALGNSDGFINAKIVGTPNEHGTKTYTISALKGTIRDFQIKKDSPKPTIVPNNDGQFSFGFDNNSKVGKVMDENTQKERYRKLSQMFGLKEEGKCTNADIAKVVGATSNADFSQKIHEYLGEDYTVSDKELLQKMYKVYKGMQAEKQQPVKPSIQKTVSIPNVAPVNPTNNVVQTSEPLKKDNADDSEDIKRMKELIKVLTKAAEVYYSGEDEIMSNYEYDKLYDELSDLEKKTGTVLQGSLTQQVGFEVKSKLTKVKHKYPALSLDKTKDRVELSNALGGQDGFLSWKLDGLTIVLSYENGELISAVTRGDGKIGEDITHNAKFFAGVPLKIGYKEDLVVRGEALITYEQFDKINSTITSIEDKYKNPRNLASGSVRQLDSKIAKERNVRVVAFTVVEGFDNLSNYTEKLDELKKYGFETVEYVKVTKDTTVKAIEEFEKRVKLLKYPTDGLVITIDNIAYGDMLGMTAKFPRNAKAFKWKDENYESEMLDIDWSVGRTGAITPVAVFKPVDIEGSTVRRASVHNVSIFKQLKLGKGDTVNIFRANLIIPQIASNITQSGTFEIPKVCPICGHPTSIVKANDAEVLMCNNPNCTARHLGGLSHFVSRDCMNIDGLSDATLEVFVNEGFVKTFKDIYHLNQYETQIVALDGFGKGSYNKIWKAIEASRECELPAFIGSLGIPQLGKGTSKDVCKAIDYDLNKLVNMSEAELSGIPGVGGKTAKEVSEYFAENKQMVLDLAEEMHFKAMPKIDRNSPIAGMTFCITGDVYTFKNRKELQAKIESLGAKAAGSVSAKTTYLINNDVTSASNKNQTAKKLGVPIISEADFLKMIGE